MRRRRGPKEGQEKRKRENRQPILKKLCAALMRSFRGQHSEKMKGSARGDWDPWEGQQPFRSYPNGVGNRYHVEAAVDWCRTKISRREYCATKRFFTREFIKKKSLATCVCISRPFDFFVQNMNKTLDLFASIYGRYRYERFKLLENEYGKMATKLCKK